MEKASSLFGVSAPTAPLSPTPPANKRRHQSRTMEKANSPFGVSAPTAPLFRRRKPTSAVTGSKGGWHQVRRVAGTKFEEWMAPTGHGSRWLAPESSVPGTNLDCFPDAARQRFEGWLRRVAGTKFEEWMAPTGHGSRWLAPWIEVAGTMDRGGWHQNQHQNHQCLAPTWPAPTWPTRPSTNRGTRCTKPGDALTNRRAGTGHQPACYRTWCKISAAIPPSTQMTKRPGFFELPVLSAAVSGLLFLI